MHSLVCLRLHIATARVAATSAVGAITVPLIATACPVKAVLPLQLEGQHIGKRQAITVRWESLHKEPGALHARTLHYSSGLTAVHSFWANGHSQAHKFVSECRPCLQLTSMAALSTGYEDQTSKRNNT